MAELDDKLKNSVNERIAAEAQYTSVLSNISAQLKSLAASTDNITKEQNKIKAYQQSLSRATQVNKSAILNQQQLILAKTKEIVEINKQIFQSKQLYKAKQEQIASARDNIAYSKSQISVAEQELSASKKNTTSLREKETVQKSQIAALQQEVATIQNRSKQQVTARKGAPNTSVLTKAEESLVAQLTARKESIRSAFDATVAARKAEISRTAELGVALSDLTNGLPELDNSLSKLQSESSVLTKAEESLVAQLTARTEELKRLTLEEQLMQLQLKKVNNIFTKFGNVLNHDLTRELVQLGTALKRLTDSIYATQQRFGVSFDTAATLYKDTLVASAKSFFSAATGKGPYVSQEEILAAGQSFTKQFGTVLQPEEMNRIAQEAKKLGVSSESYVNAKRAFLGTGNEEAARTVGMSEFAKAGLSAGQAIQFAAENADLVAVAGNKYAGALYRAAADAKKIGVSLGDIEKFANNIVGDFEGSLEKFSELSAMGIDLDFNQIAAVSATGTPEEILATLRQQLQQTGISGEELQTNRQLRLALTQATGMDEAVLLRMSPQAGKPKEATLGESQLAVAKESNTHLATIAQALGAAGSIFSTVVGIASKIAGFGGAIYQFVLAQRISKVTDTLAKMGGGSAATGGGGVAGAVKDIFGRGAATPAIPTVPPGGGAGLTSVATGTSSFSGTNILKGAAAMLVVAASVYVLGKGLQEFNTVKWEDMGKAAIALGVITAAAFGLFFIAPEVIIGALAIAALGASIIPFAFALNLAAPALGTLSSFIGVMSQLNAGQVGILALMGPALGSMAVGLAALGVAAVVAAPGLAILGGLGFGLQKLGVLPTAPVAGTPVTGPAPAGAAGAAANTPSTRLDTSKMEAKLDQVVTAIKGMKVEMDGHTVGRVSLNASSPLGRLAVVG